MDQFNIEKKNHSIKETVRPDFVEAVVLLSSDLYFRLNLNTASMGAVAKATYERSVYTDLTAQIFNEDLPFVHCFSSPQELSDYKARFGIKVAANNANDWFKTVCLDVSKEHPLLNILDYIGRKSDEFEKVNYRLP